MKNRIKYIDIAKGIAILSIILGHFGVNEVNRIVYTFHVPIFFFITGYFVNCKLSIKEFTVNKMRTLIVPYCFTCIVIIGLAVLFACIKGEQNVLLVAGEWLYASVYGAGDSFTEPFYIKPIGAIWFLLASFWGSLLLRISLEMKKGTRIAFVLLLFMSGYWSAQALFWLPFSIQAGCCATLFMYLGYLVKKAKQDISKLPIEVKIVTQLGAFAVWIWFIINFQSFWLVNCNFGRGVIDIIGCICACYCVFLVSKFIENNFKRCAEILAYIGRYSLLVLCIHIVELNLFPWKIFDNSLVYLGVPVIIARIIRVIVKYIFILTLMFLGSKNVRITQMFGLKGNKG